MRRLWEYIKSWFRIRTEAIKDPEVELEQAITAARKRDQELRNQAARVIAHRTRLEQEIEQAAEDSAEAKEMAKQALLKSDSALKSGNADQGAKWTQAAQTLAMRLQAAESNLESLKKQYALSQAQSDQAKNAVQQNALQLQEMSAKRMELLGKLEQAKMQESVNKAMEAMNATVTDSAPSLAEVEDKIQERMAMASAKTELTSSTPEGAMVELKQSVSLTKADATLDALRAELGLVAAPEEPTAASTPATPETEGQSSSS